MYEKQVSDCDVLTNLTATVVSPKVNFVLFWKSAKLLAIKFDLRVQFSLYSGYIVDGQFLPLTLIRNVSSDFVSQ